MPSLCIYQRNLYYDYGKLTIMAKVAWYIYIKKCRNLYETLIQSIRKIFYPKITFYTILKLKSIIFLFFCKLCRVLCQLSQKHHYSFLLLYSTYSIKFKVYFLYQYLGFKHLPFNNDFKSNFVLRNKTLMVTDDRTLYPEYFFSFVSALSCVSMCV